MGDDGRVPVKPEGRRLLDEGGASFRDLLEMLPAAAYTCDAAGLITYYNPQAVEIWGRAPKLNDPIDRFCGSFKLFAADGTPIAHDQCWMAQALRTGEAYNGAEIIIEREHGTRVTALAHANPVYDRMRKLVGAVNVLVDISDRKRAEEALARLAAIVESSEDAIVSKSLEGRIQTWNSGAERLFGYTAAEAVGAPITLIIPPERREEEVSILSRLRRGERIEHYETVRVSKLGHRIDVSLSVSPIRDGRGRIIGAAKVARDISEQKRAAEAISKLNAQLRQSDERKDEFLATLAHELRNPLAPLSNALEILRLSDDLSPAAERIRDVMDRQVQHMTRLVDDLLEVSRITRGKIELRKETADLAAIVLNAVETSRPLIDAAGHQLAIMLSPQPIGVEADPVRLSQVIANLLNNSAKYTPAGGQIWLTARQEGQEALVSVRDNGTGIPAQILPHVFDMFAQADRTLDRSQGGLGIGLSLARSLVQMHGGRIDAFSDGPGRGSEFVVRLPISGNVPAPPAADVRRRRALPSRSILIVDDARAAVFTLGALLETMGQRVYTAADAAAALEHVRQARPDIVISDIAMPKMNGYELARRLRAERGCQGLVLVALTGYGQDSDRRRAKEAGFDYHLVKPVSSQALQDLLALIPDSPNTQQALEGA